MRQTVKDILLCLSLSFAAVGLKNFNPGLTIDGPLYAALARQIAVGAEWFHLGGGVPPYQPFFEHPHLFFWITAFWLKIMPHEDWAVRSVSHICFFLTLWGGLSFLRRLSGEKAAAWFPLLMVLMTSNSAWYGNVFMDPMFLLLGAAALCCFVQKRWLWSGALLALSFMTKGTAALAFGPPFLVAAVFLVKDLKGAVRAACACLTVLALYLVLLHLHNPEFLPSHYDRHFTNRFSGRWNFFNVVSKEFLLFALKDSQFLILGILALFAFKKSRLWAWVLATWVLSFSLMYAGAGRMGGWYMLPISLAAAVGAALALGHFFDPRPFTKHLTLVACFFVCLVQYTPVQVQKNKTPEVFFKLRKTFKEIACSRAYCGMTDSVAVTGPIAWTAQVFLSSKESDPNLQCAIQDSGHPVPVALKQKFARVIQVDQFSIYY
jgi:4-amino-4-deoxy-L-arabinose transferase-like glycosyltransferase